VTSRQERDRRRAERLAAEQKEAAAEKRRLLLGYLVAGGLTLAVVVGIFVAIANSGGDESEQQVDGKEIPATAHIELQSGSVHGFAPDGREGTPPPAVQQGDLETAAREARCELRLDLEDEGSDHITDEGDIPDYDTNPATSGNHNPNQQADGAYSEQPDPWYVIHSLEHGRIEIQYSPDLPEAEQLELKGLFEEDFDGMLMFPNPKMPYAVAATAWTQMLGCPTYEGRATIDALRAFRDTFRGRGPEAVAVMIPDEG
jgi:8-oxo-dGTP pyrophosphatase MutT (NUDIX family)